MARFTFIRALTLLLLSGTLIACRGGGSDTVNAAPQPATPVTVAPVTTRDVAVTIDATGSFAAAESSEVAPEASGRIVATPVDIGSSVKQGDVLVRLRSVDAALKLDEAQAAVNRANANLALAESQNTLAQTTSERYANLLATGDVSRTVADQARTQAETQQQTVATSRASLAEAQAQLQLAQTALADVVVRAPFSGFISARPVAVGMYVQPNNPVATLVQIDPLRLRLTIPGVQAGRLAIGQVVTATVDAFPDRKFTGTIAAISPSIEPQSRSFIVEARVRNPDAVLKPGMFAVATIDQGRTEKAFFVPHAAVAEDVNTDSYRVFVIDKDNHAHLRVVQLSGSASASPVRLMDGVKEGERVATSGLADLYEGAPVVVNQDGGGSTPHAETR